MVLRFTTCPKCGTMLYWLVKEQARLSLGGKAMTYENQNTVHREGGPGEKWNIWRTITIGLGSIVVVICIVFFAVPLVKVPVQVVENYTETEYKDEAYTESEPYTTQVTTEVTESKSETLYDGSLVVLWHRVMPDRWGTEVYFNIDLVGKSNPVVSGSWEIGEVSNPFYVTITDPGFTQVYKYLGSQGAAQSDDFEFIPKLSGMYLMRFSTDYIRFVKYGRLTMVFKWDEVTTKTAERTDYKQVTKYRQVPVEVTKQRTGTKYERVSIWRFLSSKTPAKTQ
jgi:hypothetical protein